jgi:hypothetical protein
MKPILNFITLIWLAPCFSQTTIEPYPLEISTGKTTNIIFPFGIRTLDRGSRDILIQRNGNILELKAAKENFNPTNVTVTTIDGTFYSFLLSYAAEPARLNISFTQDSLESPLKFLRLSASDGEIKVTLESIYMRKNLLWFGLKMKNYSMIDYDPETIRFFITEKRKLKRRAIQLDELTPMYVRNYSVIAARTSKELNFAFMPFTFDKGKRLVIEFREKNGGRSLALKVSSRILLKSR